MTKYRKIGSEYLYRGRVVTLRIDTLKDDDGKESKREVVEHHGAVAIVPYLNDDTILLIRQYRQAVDSYLLEIPAGTLEEGENPENCAYRELEEEIGYRAATMRHMFTQYLAPGYSSEALHVFLAKDLTLTQTHFDEDEEIELVPVRPEEVEPMILDGRICDAKSIAALLVAIHLL